MDVIHRRHMAVGSHEHADHIARITVSLCEDSATDIFAAILGSDVSVDPDHFTLLVEELCAFLVTAATFHVRGLVGAEASRDFSDRLESRVVEQYCSRYPRSERRQARAAQRNLFCQRRQDYELRTSPGDEEACIDTLGSAGAAILYRQLSPEAEDSFPVFRDKLRSILELAEDLMDV
jgi:hypothetical protein